MIEILQGSGIGHTAVHWCAAKGHLTCLQWLLQQGADINCLNAEDSTPLHAAAANGQEDIVHFLLDQSATKGNDSSGLHC
jgi:ankyrin repeat protein